MTSNPPSPHALPQGMTDVDYEAIEAAVTETVRGRWFLKEFARRNRGVEVKLMLDAMTRIETLVTVNQAPALPPSASADPSIRLLVQRIKDIAGQLDGLARDMRDGGVDDRFTAVVDFHARAVAGLMRSGTMPETARDTKPVPHLEQPASRPERREIEPARLSAPPDARLRVFSGLDGLSLAKKLALFS